MLFFRGSTRFFFAHRYFLFSSSTTLTAYLHLLSLSLSPEKKQIAYERLLNVNRRVWILPLRFAYKMSIDVRLCCCCFAFFFFSLSVSLFPFRKKKTSLTPFIKNAKRPKKHQQVRPAGYALPGQRVPQRIETIVIIPTWTGGGKRFEGGVSSF